MNRENCVAFLRRSRKTILVVVATVVITLAVILAVRWWFNPQDDAHFPSSGILRTVNVKAYWDESHLNETKEISWGIVYPGSSYSNTLFLQSLSNVDASLEMTTGNWTFWDSHGATVLGPINETSYMNLTWDYVDRSISPKETVPVTLTLNVTDSSDFVLFIINNDVKEFGVDIAIRAFETA